MSHSFSISPLKLSSAKKPAPSASRQFLLPGTDVLDNHTDAEDFDVWQMKQDRYYAYIAKSKCCVDHSVRFNLSDNEEDDEHLR